MSDSNYALSKKCSGPPFSPVNNGHTIHFCLVSFMKRSKLMHIIKCCICHKNSVLAVFRVRVHDMPETDGSRVACTKWDKTFLSPRGKSWRGEAGEAGKATGFWYGLRTFHHRTCSTSSTCSTARMRRGFVPYFPSAIAGHSHSRCNELGCAWRRVPCRAARRVPDTAYL